MDASTWTDAAVPAPYPAEFRQRAVELVRRGDKPVATLATELRISVSCRRNWVAQADAEESGSVRRLTSAAKKELAALRRDKRRRERENEILQRAAASVAGEHVLPKYLTGWSVSSLPTASTAQWPAGCGPCPAPDTPQGGPDHRRRASRRTRCCAHTCGRFIGSLAAATAGRGGTPS